MQPIHQQINRLLSSKITVFLKNSFFIALLYSTLLYILVRLFFYEFPFTIGEGFELHYKILLVVWIFFIACQLVFKGIVLAENNINKMSFGRMMYIPVLKKIHLILLAVLLVYTGKASATENAVKGSSNNSGEESAMEKDNNLL
ncbi:MAG: hypothetical protein H7Z13_00865 [Ferruginibacter sp.]|nr:hypothetical protein [Ferruginibacter sp.]